MSRVYKNNKSLLTQERAGGCPDHGDGLSAWDVDRLYWKQKMELYKSVIVTPILKAESWLLVSGSHYLLTTAMSVWSFSLHCSSLGIQSWSSSGGHLKKKRMKRYQLWKSDFLFWIQLLWTSLSLFRWEHHNLIQTQILWTHPMKEHPMVRLDCSWAQSTHQLKQPSSTSSQADESMYPSQKQSSCFIGFIMIHYGAQMRQAKQR